jgi:hypothetical protein
VAGDLKLAEEKAVRRSFHLMKMFLSWDKYFALFVKKKLPVVGTKPSLFFLLCPRRQKGKG